MSESPPVPNRLFLHRVAKNELTSNKTNRTSVLRVADDPWTGCSITRKHSASWHRFVWDVARIAAGESHSQPLREKKSPVSEGA